MLLEPHHLACFWLVTIMKGWWRKAILYKMLCTNTRTHHTKPIAIVLTCYLVRMMVFELEDFLRVDVSRSTSTSDHPTQLGTRAKDTVT